MKPIDNFSISWISLTYNCNNKCSWCYAASNQLYSKSKTLDNRYEQGIVNLLSDLKVKRIILIGGEPTLYNNLYGLLEKTANSGIKTGMVTNGRRLSKIEFTNGLKSRNLDYLTVSIEGYDSKSHDSVTGIIGSYNESIRGIEVARSKGINVSTNTVISSENVGSLERIVNSLIEREITNIGFNVCGICVSKEDNNSSLISPLIASKAFGEVYKKFKGQEINFKLVTPIPFCFFDNTLKKELEEKRVISGGPCQLVHGKNFVIDYNGDIIPCTHMTGFPEFNILESGKVISKDKFIKLYNDPLGMAYNFRKKLSRYPSSKCNDCNESCSGGCPLYWINFDPEKEIIGVNNA